jgi:hypothetical protein
MQTRACPGLPCSSVVPSKTNPLPFVVAEEEPETQPEEKVNGVQISSFWALSPKEKININNIFLNAFMASSFVFYY